MALGRINGPMLQPNLERQGVNIALDANLTYWDVNNRYVGINTTTPNYPLEVRGNVRAGNVYLLGNSITTVSGILNLGSNANITISGGSLNYTLTTDGNGNLSWANIASLATSSGLTANNITLGANSVQSLVSNAVTLTQSTSVTNAIASLNYVLGKLVPPSPPNFPGNVSTISVATTNSGYMANFVQTDNSGWGNLSVAAGTSVSALRTATFSTSGTAIMNVGPGTNGTVTAYVNGTPNGNVVLTGSNSNTTNGNLYVYNVIDYHNVSSSVTAGFWSVFSTYATATAGVPAGWNRVSIYDTGTATGTNNATWYYDSSSPSAPSFSGTSMTFSSNTVTYSPSTIPHLNGSAGFTIVGGVQNLSGDTYPLTATTGLFTTQSNPTGMTAPVNVSYFGTGVGLPLTRNNTAVATFRTTSNISSGFGVIASSAGPTVTVTNNYTPATSPTFAVGSTVLYKTTNTGSTSLIDETNIIFNSAVGGSTTPAAFRVNNPDTGTATDNPAFTAGAAAFSTLYATDVTNVGNANGGTGPGLKWDNTNYSTGYIPVGPNLSGRSGSAAQYFTFKFVRTGVSKFGLVFTTTGSTTGIAGMWCALPGNPSGYNAGNVNGWLSMATDYSISGGCSLGGVLSVNGSNTTYTLNCSFGTASSSNSTNNEIWIRIKLTSGQVLSALYLQASTV
jgi:hypothetical protein